MSKIEDLKGFIDFPSGFKLLGPAPVDARYAGEDEEFLTSIVEANAAYPGLKVYIKSTNQFYSYTKGDDGEYSFKVDSVSLTSEQQAALDSGITSEKVAEIGKKYVKPENGIPLADLAKEVEDKMVEVASSKSKEISDSMENRIRSASDTATSALTKATSAEASANSAILKNTEQEAEIAKIKEDMGKLPTNEEVISLIAKNSGRQLSVDSNGNAFPSLDKLFSGPWFYNGTQLSTSDLNEGDQAYVLASEGSTSKTMTYTGSGWATAAEGAYQFTEAEQDALESGITAEKVSQIQSNKDSLAAEVTRATQAEANILSQADSISDSKVGAHNSSTESHQDIRAKLSEVDNLAKEAKSLGESGISKADAAQSTANDAKANAATAQSTADAAKTSASEAKNMVNTLESNTNSKLAGKQDSLLGGGAGNSNLLIQPESLGGQPTPKPIAELISEIDTSKIQPVKEELQAKITAVENKNNEQDSAIQEAKAAADAAQESADQAQSTADSKVGSVVEGSTDGSISVDGSDIKVHGLKSLAYKDGLSKEEVGLGNVSNVEQASKEEFNLLKTRVESMEKLGQFVGSYEAYTSLPAKVSEIESKYGVSATVNDFATVRKGPYPTTDAEGNSTGLTETDVTCWSIYNIDSEGNIGWAYEFTYDIDISGKTDKVTGAEDKIATFDSTGNLKASDKKVSDLVSATETAQSTAEGAQSSADAAQEAADAAQSTADSKYLKPGTGVPKEDLNSEVQSSLGKADTSVQKLEEVNADENGNPLVGGIRYTTADGSKKYIKAGGLGNLAGKSIGDETKDKEGILKQNSSGEFEIYSAFIAYIPGVDGESLPTGLSGITTLAWRDVDENQTYSIKIPAVTHGNKGKLGTSLYFPKVRAFWVEGLTSLTEIFDSITFNQTTGEVTIKVNYKRSMVIIIE